MPKMWTEHRQAGADWASAFMKRHKEEISMRTPEPTSLQRMSSLNKHNLFYDNLEKVMKKGFACERTWNVDETGITTVQKPARQIAQKGDKRVGAIVAQERGTLVTVCCSISAIGNHIPPFLVFPRVNVQDHWRLTLPPSSVVEGHPKASGWMTQENFTSFLKHFANHTRPTSESPVLLLLDNHKSHISAKAINFCRQNHITLLSFPPHCSHELQPLDKCVFGPFKTFCNQASDRWYHDASNAG
ncbi:jerky protein [Biomphalaria pfeifferi]|uniref:Jerky protein n=1 Tax=Biomphalaria pfeifferi TaxID=112525 RepID=A0AAD8F7P9_BIOPF|nr:jerky protein [Biomphalaria pfeifferi]